MKRLSIFAAICAICGGLLLTGCGKLSGTWETANGIASVSFQSGKAFVTTMGATELCDFEMKGDKIIVYTKQDNVVFTRNEDGTIDGPLGNMKKRRSS
jgi:hypothetical protein